MNSEEVLALRFIKSHPVDAARLLEQLPAESTMKFLGECPPTISARIVEFLTPSLATLSLEKMAPKTAADVVAELPLDIAAIQLRPMNEASRAEILAGLPGEISQPLETALKFVENTAGALMDQQAFVLQDDLTVGEALNLFKTTKLHLYYYAPVINRDREFVGVTSVRTLMLSEPDDSVVSLTESSTATLSPTSTREAILAHPAWRVYPDLPVVDENGVFLGVIAYQVIRQLETDTQASGAVRPAYDAGRALGELYWIGMSAFFKGAAALVTEERPLLDKESQDKKNATT